MADIQSDEQLRAILRAASCSFTQLEQAGGLDGAFAEGGTMLGKIGSPRTSAKKRAVVLLFGLVVAALLGLGLAPAAMAMPVQFFYVPFPEDQLLAMLTAVELGGSGNAPAEPITSYITITAVASGTIIYYDQWENGYDIDIANTYNVYSATNLGGTQIWGDGNAANGSPPGVSSDLIHAGTVIQLTNDVTTTTRQSVIDFDGGDKIAATKTIAITRSSWAEQTGTLFAGCVEVFDTNNWGTDYRAPIGTNVANSYQMFEYTALSIMAGQDGATISVDTNNDGDYTDAGDVNARALAEGASTYVTGVYYGAHVVSNRPVQVDIFTGDIASNYESRDSALVPTNLWSSSYYTPVSTPDVATNSGDERTTVWLYNPGTSAVSVTYQRRTTAGALTTSTVSVPAGGVAKQILENATDGTGARFYSTGASFYAFSTTDSASATTSYNQAWDWGYSLVPEEMLTTEALVGLGIGRDPESTVNPDENGNPVWVTTVGNGDTAATVYVDYDADPTTGSMQDASGYWCDASYSLKELQQARIYANTKVNVDATSSGTTGSGTSSAILDITHLTGSGPNRLMLVSVAIANDSTTQRNVSGVTYGGTALTYVGSVLAPTGGGGDNSTTYLRPQVEIWALANPPSGSATVRVTLSGAKAFVAGVTTFSGADVSNGLTSALGTFASASAKSGTTQSVNATTTAGQLVYDVVAAGVNGRGNATDPSTFTVGAGQAQLWTAFALSEDGTRDRHVRGAGSTETATGTSTTMSWTTSTSYPWAIGAVPINPRITKTDQTGILVYTLNPNVKLAVAWGQDPQTSTAGAPGLDVGTSVPPMPEFTAGKDGLLYDDPSTPGVIDGDHDRDGYITCGDEIVWPITVHNVSRVPVPDVIVSDVIPADTTYVPNSTYLNGTTLIPDSGSTAFPLDEGGYNYGNLLVSGSFTVSFRVTIDAYADLTSGTLAIFNNGHARALDWEDPVDDRVYLRGRISNFVWWDEDADGIQDPTEGGIAGVTITLFDGAGNVVYTDQGVQITTVTDGTGLYDFTGLLPGSYIVEFIPPEDTQITLQYQGGNTTLDSNANPATNRTGVITIGGGQHDFTVDAGIVLTTPTQAVVNSFAAYVADGKVVVGWETASEIGTAGFYVERQVGQSDQWIRVNQALVPALFESPSGGSYGLVDTGAQPYKALTYRLVEVETSGSRLTHGPYNVTAAGAMPKGGASGDISQGNQTVRIPDTSMTTRGNSPGGNHSSGSRLGGSGGSPNATQLRIEVIESGLYRVGAADIAAELGLSEQRVRDLIRSKGLNLTKQDKTVAYLQADGGSALYFYGEAIDSIYTSTNVYWLSVAKGTTMESAKTVMATGSPVVSFVDRVHVEQDLFDYTPGFHDPESDFWLWNYFVAGDVAGGDRQTIDVDVPDALAGVRLEVQLLGLTTVPQANEHHVRVRLNGTVLGDTWWTGTAEHRANFAIPAGALKAGANQVQVVAMLDGGVAYSVVALDSLDLSYQRYATAIGDQLLLTAPSKSPLRVEASSSTQWVLDVSSPLAPKLVDTKKSSGDGGPAWLTFNADAGRKYLVAATNGALDPVTVSAATPSALRAGSGGVYVVITTDALYGAASRLAAYRAGQGLQTRVVTTTEIYDGFNYGIASPHAIQSFIAYAATQWRPKAEYVVLAGEGSYDYKNFAAYNDSLVPPLMVDTEFGLVPSDVLLADTQGSDGVPEVAIGRIPALTEADLDIALAKIRAYEAAAPGAWRQAVVLAADNADEAGAFGADSDTLAASLPGSVTVSKVYLDALSLAAARALLRPSFADSALLIDYVGHAGVDQWADEGLMTGGDVAGLPVSSKLPIVNALTCLVGQFGLPGYDSLSESLVKRAGAGAIAVWAPTAMEDNQDSARLGTLFAQRLFDPARSVVLGKVIRASLQAGAAEGLPAWFLQTYSLLGDPALKVSW
jgi:uncharacterized repeat protein (TIGR01451 family)